jgi:hypothetical protein
MREFEVLPLVTPNTRHAPWFVPRGSVLRSSCPPSFRLVDLRGSCARGWVSSFVLQLLFSFGTVIVRFFEIPENRKDEVMWLYVHSFMIPSVL